MCVVWVCAVCLWCVIGVLLVCLVVCVGVRRCVWLWCRTHSQDHGNINILMYMSVSLFFAHFLLTRKRSLEHLLSMMSAFRRLWPFTMVSCFLLLVAVSTTFLDFRKSSVAWRPEKCMKQLREGKNMKPLWKVKGFEKQTSWKRLRFSMIKWAKRVTPTCTCTSFCTCRCKTWESQESKTRVNTTHHIQEGHGYSCLLHALVLNHFDIQSRRGYACRVSSFVWKISPHWHSELSVEVVSCQHHMRPLQEKKRQRGASSTCEQQFTVRSWADLPWHCLSRNF